MIISLPKIPLERLPICAEGLEQTDLFFFAGAGQALGTAASLAFLRLTFPEQMPQVQRWLARVGTAQAAQIVASAVVQNWRQQQSNASHPAAGHRQPFWMPHSRHRKTFQGDLKQLPEADELAAALYCVCLVCVALSNFTELLGKMASAGLARASAS